MRPFNGTAAGFVGYGDGARRTGKRTGTAADTGLGEIFAEGRRQLSFHAPFRQADGGYADNLFTGAGAVGAEDTLVVSLLLR